MSFLKNSMMRLRSEPPEGLGEEGATRIIRTLPEEFPCTEAIRTCSCNRGDIKLRTFGFLPYSIVRSSRHRLANRTEFVRIVLCLAWLQLVNSLSHLQSLWRLAIAIAKEVL